MAIYAENSGEIPVGPIEDDAGTPVEGATVTVSLLRSGTAVWSDEFTTDAAGLINGSADVPVPHPLPAIGAEVPTLVVGEILTEKVQVSSGTLRATYYNDRRVRERRS